MTAKTSEPRTPDSGEPFGADARRSRTPVALLIVLYVLWFLLLFWMAAYRPGA